MDGVATPQTMVVNFVPAKTEHHHQHLQQYQCNIIGIDTKLNGVLGSSDLSWVSGGQLEKTGSNAVVEWTHLTRDDG